MKPDDIYFTGGTSEPCWNLTQSVGFKSANLYEDVMLIQAMIQLIALWDPVKAGVGRDYKVPPVNGIMDVVTQRAIEGFQIANASRLLAVDGRIDVARYKGRKLRRGDHRVMTITLLHYLATDANMMVEGDTIFRTYEPGYQARLGIMFPQLKTMFEMATDRAVLEG